MKTLTTGIACAMLALLFSFAGCANNPVEPAADNFQPFAKNAAPAAETHPAITFTALVSTAKGNVHTVQVQDSTGGSTNHIVCQATSTSDQYSNATWSPTGSSISFRVFPVGGGTGTYAIKAVDVVKDRQGQPSGKNVRTVYTAPTATKILGQAWCPVASVGKIAFITQSATESAIYTVSSSGGAATKIYSLTAAAGDLSAGGAICWSPDATQLAFVERTAVGGGFSYAIKIITASGGVNANLVADAFATIAWLQWSHTGLDEIAFAARRKTMNDAIDLYKISATAGATPTLLLAGTEETVDGVYKILSYAYPWWSPDNSELEIGVSVRNVWNGGANSVAGGNKYDIATATRSGFTVYLGDWRSPIW